MSLTSVDDIKTYLQITTTATDSLLELYRDLIESEIEAWTNSQLIEDTYTNEVLNYDNSTVDASTYTQFNTRLDKNKLFTKNGWITAFTLISDTTTVSADNYRLREISGTIELENYYDDSDEKLKTTYTAGFTTATSPTNLKSVVYEGVRSLYENNKAAKQGAGDVKSKQIKDFSVSYGNANTSYVTTIDNQLVKRYLESNKTTLNKYKRVYA